MRTSLRTQVVAEQLASRRREVVSRWLAAARAQPFHVRRRSDAVADSIPQLFDALVDLLRGPSASQRVEGAPLRDAAVLDAARAHAALRYGQGLDEAAIMTELRLLRDVLGGVLASLPDSNRARAAEALAAQTVLFEALDGAVLREALGHDRIEGSNPSDQVAADTDLLHLLVERVEEYAIFLLDPGGRVASWNTGAERIKGYAAHEIVGRPYDTFFTDEDRAAGKPQQLLQRARLEGSVEDEGWRVRKDGARFWADALLTALFDGERLLGYAKVTRDLTAQREAEAQRLLGAALRELVEGRDRALAEAEAERRRLHELFMQAPAIIAVLRGPEHVFELVNPPYLKITGRRDASQLLGKPMRDALPEVVDQGYLELLDGVYRTGEPFVANEALVKIDRRGDGMLADVYLNFVYQPTRDLAGNISGILVHAVDVTEQVRARQRTEELATALAGERQRFAAIFDQATVGIAQADLEGRFELVNDRYCEIVGRSRAELLGGLRMQDITHPDDLPRNDQLFEHLVREGAAYAIEKRYVRPDGSDIWVRNSVSRIGDPDGLPRYALAVSEDITDRKRAEAAAEADLRDTRRLRDLGARFAAETDAAALHQQILAAALAITGADGGTVQLLDEQTSELTLLATSGFERAMTTHFHRVDASSGSPCGIALATGARSVVDFDDPRASDADGSNRLHREAGYRSAQSTPLVGRSGRPVGMLSTHWRAHHRPSERELRFLDLLARQSADLIDGKRSEDALRESEERLRALVTASSNVVYRMSPDWSEMWHLQGREFIPDTPGPSRTWLDKYIPPADQARVMAAIQDAIRSKGVFELEHRVCQVDGTVGWTFSRAIPLLGGDGEIVEWFGMATDVTRRKLAEEALRESEERFRTLAANISQFAWMADPTGHIFWYNRRWFEYTGTTLEEMQGWGWTTVHHPDHVDRVVARIQHAWDTGEPWEDTFPLRGKDGQYRWFLSRALPIRDASGAIVRWFGTNTDITELRDAQQERERLLAAERAAREEAEAAVRTRDEFLATASHDLQSPLSTVKGHAQLLRRRVQGGDAATLDRDRILSGLGSIDSAANRMSALIGELVDVTRLELGQTLDLTRQQTDLVALVRRVVAERPEAADGGRFRVESSEPELIGFWDPVRLERVLGNLLSNAAKYSPQDAPVRVEVGHERGAAAGDGVAVVSVVDCGVGIPAANLPHIFQRFHRASNVAGKVRGTGLGLWGARRIVEQHAGTIEVESEDGRGSTFTVRLPLGTHQDAAPVTGELRGSPVTPNSREWPPAARPDLGTAPRPRQG